LGCDLDKITAESLAIITNEELISVNQDSLGIQASFKLNCVFNSSDPYAILTEPQVYAGPLTGGDLAVIIVNWSPFTFNQTLVVSMLDLGFALD
jgi:alpha-galactosidase